MNLVIVRDHEVRADGRVTLTDRRARHLVNVLNGSAGQSVRTGILNGPTGSGVIETIDPDHVTLRCNFTQAPPREPVIDLLLALPRPKVMKRLWAPLASLGVRRIVLTNAAKVERNYFDTHWLAPEHYEPLLIEGLEQAAATQLPAVSVVRRFKPFMEDELDALFPDSTRIVAHPDAEPAPVRPDHASTTLVALGPEGGWTDFELGLLEQHGFMRMSLGRRILRSDTACIALISIVRHASTNP